MLPFFPTDKSDASHFLALNSPATCVIQMLTSDEEVSMLFQSLAVLSDHVIQAKVQFVEGERLLRVRSRFSCWVVISFLRTKKYQGKGSEAVKYKLLNFDL